MIRQMFSRLVSDYGETKSLIFLISTGVSSAFPANAIKTSWKAVLFFFGGDQVYLYNLFSLSFSSRKKFWIQRNPSIPSLEKSEAPWLSLCVNTSPISFAFQMSFLSSSSFSQLSMSHLKKHSWSQSKGDSSTSKFQSNSICCFSTMKSDSNAICFKKFNRVVIYSLWGLFPIMDLLSGSSRLEEPSFSDT